MRRVFHRPYTSGPRQGFTLLELLLAVTMYGLMIAGLVSTVYTALRLRERTRNLVEQSSIADIALQTLRTDLLAMAPPSGQLQRPIYGLTQDGPAGRRDELEFGCFTGRVHPDEVWGDLHLVRYTLIEPAIRGATTGDTSGQGLVLARYVMRNLLSTIDLEEDPQVLQRDVLSLEFSYYYEEEWLDSWDSENMENATPEAVEVRLTYEIPEKQEQLRDAYDSGRLARQETKVLVVPITVKPISEPEETEEEGQEQQL